MKASLPVSLVEGWINELQSILKADALEAKTGTGLFINQGMRHGLDQIQHRVNIWRRHQKYVQALNRLGRKFLMVRRVNLSDGRYRKLEWYEGDLFVTLAWRHARDAAEGELMLEIQDTRDLSKIFLVYLGGSSFEDLAGLARAGGLDSIKNEENWGEWGENI
ncbi:MAG: hypothetical protein HY912_01650 [Desulfomonile tiedjei]|uniref:Uncharacterized protein n=1 Tax=Desulfomonile tiedjei TaxID=2358 RepID=A0A9D6YYW7_9BACT|nr:hypothetical protein [Desulfomonile tiedjei]